jgi:hypothetical protein
MAQGEKVDPEEQEDPSVVAYQKALEAFVSGNAQEALRLLPQATALGAKSAFLNALCIGKLQGEKAYISALKMVVSSYPNTAESAQAQNYLTALGESPQ